MKETNRILDLDQFQRVRTGNDIRRRRLRESVLVRSRGLVRRQMDHAIQERIQGIQKRLCDLRDELCRDRVLLRRA